VRYINSRFTYLLTYLLVAVTGLTVLKADEVYDIMERDYPEKFKVCVHIDWQLQLF